MAGKFLSCDYVQGYHFHDTRDRPGLVDSYFLDTPSKDVVNHHMATAKTKSIQGNTT